MKWISIKDQLPDQLARVIVCNAREYLPIYIAIYFADHKTFRLYNPDALHHYPLDVTHWIKIPAFPEDKE